MLLGSPAVQFKDYTKADLLDICKARNVLSDGTTNVADLNREQIIACLNTDDSSARELVKIDVKNASMKMPKKKLKFTIKTIGMKPIELTPSGAAQVSYAVLSALAGENLFGDEKDVKWGDLYNFYGGGDSGAEACRAVGALAQMSQINTTIQTFLLPLQKLADKNSRIHCSLNLNTETGRLSSRNPNLQNQPALEKDLYKIRDCFCAEEGNTLIVADYGQLELRLLAHMTDCKVNFSGTMIVILIITENMFRA